MSGRRGKVPLNPPDPTVLLGCQEPLVRRDPQGDRRDVASGVVFKRPRSVLGVLHVLASGTLWLQTLEVYFPFYHLYFMAFNFFNFPGWLRCGNEILGQG